MLVVATEDELSEAVAIKLISEAHGHQLSSGQRLEDLASRP